MKEERSPQQKSWCFVTSATALYQNHPSTKSKFGLEDLGKPARPRKQRNQGARSLRSL